MHRHDRPTIGVLAGWHAPYLRGTIISRGSIRRKGSGLQLATVLWCGSTDKRSLGPSSRLAHPLHRG
jgi:hypothetical protein